MAVQSIPIWNLVMKLSSLKDNVDQLCSRMVKLLTEGADNKDIPPHSLLIAEEDSSLAEK